MAKQAITFRPAALGEGYEGTRVLRYGVTQSVHLGPGHAERAKAYAASLGAPRS
jgi:hypothetical protein